MSQVPLGAAAAVSESASPRDSVASTMHRRGEFLAPAFFQDKVSDGFFRSITMTATIPVWAIAVDYILGMIMWTLIGRFGMRLFLPEESRFFFSRFFIKITDPLLKLFKPITPEFLIPPLIPLYVAWFFYMARFYLMPWLLGYSVMGMLSFPLESEFAQGVAWLIGKIVN
jgi:uncharacterized protein YggT (Ycf19 family)